ncbi:MAG: V-type ATP synthase subunit F [Candidatus Brocadiia bacterium]
MDAHQQVKHKYLVIADEDTVLGFRCVGIAGTAVNSRTEALAALKSARDSEAGVVILTQEATAMMQEEVDALRFGSGLPLVVEIPGARGPFAGRKNLSDVIRQAIGIRV